MFDGLRMNAWQHTLMMAASHGMETHHESFIETIEHYSTPPWRWTMKRWNAWATKHHEELSRHKLLTCEATPSRSSSIDGWALFLRLSVLILWRRHASNKQNEERRVQLHAWVNLSTTSVGGGVGGKNAMEVMWDRSWSWDLGSYCGEDG